MLITLFTLLNVVTATTVTIAILAKDKAHVLPEYLQCIDNQTWPKAQTHLYIRTNNNNDATATILLEWFERVKHEYNTTYWSSEDVEANVQQYKQHEWNTLRFVVLGKIRNDSMRWAHEHQSHYFVADCDNFIKPETIANLVSVNLPIVAPLLITNTRYSNYHAAIDANGYYAEDPLYYKILHRETIGLIRVPVVHCTYLVHYDSIPHLTYDDASYRFEYVVFSHSARKSNIYQYMDNRLVYGYLTFAETRETFMAEPWYPQLQTILSPQGLGIIA